MQNITNLEVTHRNFGSISGRRREGVESIIGRRRRHESGGQRRSRGFLKGCNDECSSGGNGEEGGGGEAVLHTEMF
jgi:uncharacterized membrane protein YgcG